MKLIQKLFSITACIMLCNSAMLSAAEKDISVKTVYPVASAILMDAYRYLGELDSFSIDALTTNDDIYRDIMIQEFSHQVHIDLQRPDKLRTRRVGDIYNRSSYLSGDSFTMINETFNFYGEVQVPDTIDSALDYLFESYDIKFPLANLLYTDLDKRLAPKKNGFYFGTPKVDGHVCHHIGFVNEAYEYQLWIEKSDTPLIRKFLIIDKNEKFDLRSSSILRWEINPHFEKDHFLFSPPEEAMEIRVLLKGAK